MLCCAVDCAIKKLSIKSDKRNRKEKIGTLMGMSASQARLLSITARLTNNELSSQLLTNSKVRLASKSEEASDEYMNALSATKLTYQYYNDNGDAMNYNLTPSVIYSYEPLKSQYSIVDNNGVNLVSAQDAKNFEETNTLLDFLGRYVNVEKIDDPDTVKAHDDWDAECKRLEKEHEIAYKKWEDNPYKVNEDDTLYQLVVASVGTSQNPIACYRSALSGYAGCYIHFLNHLLDFNGAESWGDDEYRDWPNTYTTSTGVEYSPATKEGHDDPQEWWGGMGAVNELKAVSDGINETDENGEYVRKCDGDDKFVPAYDNGGKKDTDKYNLLQAAIAEGRVPTDVEILRSDYIYDAETNTATEVKSIKQKLIDLYYLVMKSLITDKTALRDTLINFTDGDLLNMSLEPIDPPVLTLPKEPKITTITQIDDKDKAQWYTNLWYMMNGSESANVVTDDKDETTNGKFVVNGAEKKNPKTANYKVIDDITAKDASWLQYALENGIVSLRQAKYFNPSEDSGKVPELESTGYMWKSVGFKNAIDIKTVEDTEKITRAQAKYEKATREIEAKDNEYDIQLKNLDTIHNALQTEYESVKNVISKNVERSFKAFS
ncbi:hypothetical protein J6E39_08180 [bacterium]|nr:hypothetical protein [bacterium]